MGRQTIKLLLGFSLFLVTSCYYDVEEELYPSNGCDSEDMSYTSDIIPILENYNCISCHTTAFASGGVVLDNFDDLKVHVDNESLLGSIKYADGYTGMPFGADPMSECDIEKIESWIYDGAKNN